MAKKISEEDRAEIAELLEQGISHTEIGSMFGYHRDTVARIAADVSNRARKVRVKLDQAITDEIIRRRQAGENAKDIAEAMGLHWSTVYRESRKAGIKGR